MIKKNTLITYGGLGLFGIFGPILFPDYTLSIAYLWMMVLMASTWDTLGGQMGYNSLGNITFFGVGMYLSAIVQIAMFYEGGVGEYTSAMGSIKPEFTDAQYFQGLFLGIVVAGIAALIISLLLSTFMFGLRGPYFAIGSLGIAVATAELTITIDYVGGASGISMPLFPGDIEFRSTFFYILCFVLAVAAHFLLRWLYSTQFGLAINAIRDDEDKAEAMGIPTLLYKRIGWGIAAFFMGAIGAIAGNMAGFIDKEVAYPIPTLLYKRIGWGIAAFFMGAIGAIAGNMAGFIDKEVAYPIPTFGIFMVAMVLLGGKGTLWGPVVGAIIFHVVKEATWTYLLNLQWIALGLILIINIVYFQQGLMGWLQTKYPEMFGIVVDKSNTSSKSEA